MSWVLKIVINNRGFSITDTVVVLNNGCSDMHCEIMATRPQYLLSIYHVQHIKADNSSCM